MWCCATPAASSTAKGDDASDLLIDTRGNALGTAKLMVTIIGAREIRSADWIPERGRSGCYCTLSVGSTEIHRTALASNALEPVWREEVNVSEYKTGEQLTFSVWDTDGGGKPTLLGKITLGSAGFDSMGFNDELQLSGAGKLKIKVKPAGLEYPPLPDLEVTVHLKKDPALSYQPLGLDLDIQDGVTAWVTGIKPGVVQSYCDNNPFGEQVMVGDFITRVNGIEGSVDKLVEVMQRETSLELLIRRPAEFAVAVDRRDPKDPVGLTFPQTPSGICLLITSVAEGAIKEWNAANAEQRVQAGDRIVAVGGQRARAAELLRLAGRGNYQLTLVRPANADTCWYCR
mmetsp:Transcript_44685/g.127493  ORF Transcript_44685/g.127493 Transcript_44685/m.127493 type:complete len:344 (+) Transcript_44685:113-1144(+)